jgi:predicted phage replisome organizer
MGNEVKWIKLTINMFDDEKVKLIESMPDADSILIIWIKLLIQAGKTNANGYIYLNENVPYTDEMIATIFNRPLNTVRLALKTFQDFGMIEMDDTGIYIENWVEHQNIEGLNKLKKKKEQNRLRQEKYRKKQKLIREGKTGNVMVTLSNGTELELELELDSELDLETEKEKEKRKDASPSELKILKLLKSVDKYPYEYDKDLEYIKELKVDYPSIDMSKEIKKWKTYKLDNPLKKKSNPRLQIHTWINNASEGRYSNNNSKNKGNPQRHVKVVN